MTRLPEAVRMVLATGDQAQEGCTRTAAIARDEVDAHESREGIRFDDAERAK